MEETIKDIIKWINSNGWIVAIITLILGAYLNTFLSKNKEVLMKIADKKGQYYSEYIDALMEVNKTHYERMRENNGMDNSKDIGRSYFHIKNLVILYGSNEVLKKLSVCEKDGASFKTEEDVSDYLDLIEAMKKDIENPKIIKSFWRRNVIEKNKREAISNILFKQ